MSGPWKDITVLGAGLAGLFSLAPCRCVRLGHSDCLILASSLEAPHFLSSRAALGAGTQSWADRK